MLEARFSKPRRALSNVDRESEKRSQEREGEFVQDRMVKDGARAWERAGRMRVIRQEEVAEDRETTGTERNCKGQDAMKDGAKGGYPGEN